LEVEDKVRGPRNRTVTLAKDEIDTLRSRLLRIDSVIDVNSLVSGTVNQDLVQIARYLPSGFVDLLFVDPPYNLNKQFNSVTFKKTNINDYGEWLDEVFSKIKHVLKPRASIYVCCDWASSFAVYSVISRLFVVRNRITWEREKGRGATRNWKNSSEDIWFCTLGDDYTFNVADVKLKRKVMAPYKDDSGEPKDWAQTAEGNFRLTHPSNLWTDITVPFWSMPENTDHPTQKPEKLVAKIVLASSNAGDFVFDPFLGSGTTSVVAKKLGRRFLGVEIDETFCCLAEKRLLMAERDRSIQGYSNGVFWERNTLNEQVRLLENGNRRGDSKGPDDSSGRFQPSLFD
jgi:DNA modification methylase